VISAGVSSSVQTAVRALWMWWKKLLNCEVVNWKRYSTGAVVRRSSMRMSWKVVPAFFQQYRPKRPLLRVLSVTLKTSCSAPPFSAWKTLRLVPMASMRTW
jgi:hypothetical protein